MIWTAGRLVADDALTISVWDRTFEHGLGLFETFRTWNGHPTLLGRHLARLSRSARELGLPLDPDALPAGDDVRALHAASGIEGDAIFRITLSGGLSDDVESVLWMRVAPLPPPGAQGARVRSTWITSNDDELAAHKSLNYWRKRRLSEAARAAGYDEDLGRIPSGELIEGTRTNIFVVPHSHGQEPGWLLTPDRRFCRILPGVMRDVVQEFWRRMGGEFEDCVEIGRMYFVDEVFLTNSVRGIIPVREFDPCGAEGYRSPIRYESPGPVTRRLWDAIRSWLEAGGPDR